MIPKFSSSSSIYENENKAILSDHTEMDSNQGLPRMHIFGNSQKVKH